MPGQKRARPKSTRERLRDKQPLPQVNSPYPGCCKPYPDATFKNEKMVVLIACHTGPGCKGYRESKSVEEWYAEIDARSGGGGDE